MLYASCGLACGVVVRLTNAMTFHLNLITCGQLPDSKTATISSKEATAFE
jgi:hypothetical protein